MVDIMLQGLNGCRGRGGRKRDEVYQILIDEEDLVPLAGVGEFYLLIEASGDDLLDWIRLGEGGQVERLVRTQDKLAVWGGLKDRETRRKFNAVVEDPSLVDCWGRGEEKD